MYWTCWGNSRALARIEKASMDGSNRTVVHNTSLVWPNGLTIDIPSQTLFWADATLSKVEASDVDGSNRRLIAMLGVNHAFALAIFNATLYMTDWTLNGLRKISISEGDVVTFSSFCERPFGVKVVDPSLQPSGKNMAQLDINSYNQILEPLIKDLPRKGQPSPTKETILGPFQ